MAQESFDHVLESTVVNLPWISNEKANLLMIENEYDYFFWILSFLDVMFEQMNKTGDLWKRAKEYVDENFKSVDNYYDFEKTFEITRFNE